MRGLDAWRARGTQTARTDYLAGNKSPMPSSTTNPMILSRASAEQSTDKPIGHHVPSGCSRMIHVLYFRAMRLPFSRLYLDVWHAVRQLSECSATMTFLSADSIEMQTDVLPRVGSRMPSEEDVVFRDISEYKSHDLHDILREVKPDIVVMWNDSFLMDAAMNAACRQEGIPTLWIQIGAVSPIPERKRDPGRQLMRKIRKYTEYGAYYAHVVGIKHALSFPVVKKLIKMTLFDESALPTVILPEFHCDHAAVFGEYYADLCEKRKGYDRQNIHVVGNYDVSSGAASLFDYDPASRLVLYVAQPLVEIGLLPKERFHSWAAALGTHLGKDFRLVVKPHPDSDLELLRWCFPQAELIDNSKANPPRKVRQVLAHFSTLNTALVARGVPLVNLVFPEIARTSEVPDTNGLALFSADDFESIVHFVQTNPDEESLKSLQTRAAFYAAPNRDFTSLTAELLFALAQQRHIAQAEHRDE